MRKERGRARATPGTPIFLGREPRRIGYGYRLVLRKGGIPPHYHPVTLYEDGSWEVTKPFFPFFGARREVYAWLCEQLGRAHVDAFWQGEIEAPVDRRKEPLSMTDDSMTEAAWCVIANDREALLPLVEAAAGDAPAQDAAEAVRQSADERLDWLREQMGGDVWSTLLADLASAAMSRVDWIEITRRLLAWRADGRGGGTKRKEKIDDSGND